MFNVELSEASDNRLETFEVDIRESGIHTTNGFLVNCYMITEDLFVVLMSQQMIVTDMLFT